MSTYEIIRQAILDKDQILATYDGHKREMCPHVIGRKHGRAQALFYQFGGSSNSGIGPAGSPGNWRCIPIDQLTDVSSRKGEWFTASNHSRRQSCVGAIDVEVTF